MADEHEHDDTSSELARKIIEEFDSAELPEASPDQLPESMDFLPDLPPNDNPLEHRQSAPSYSVHEALDATGEPRYPDSENCLRRTF